MTRACNSGRGQKKKKKKKEDGSSRSYRRPTFLPFGRVPGALSRLLFSPFPCYYRPYLGLAVSFLPRHHVPRTRVLYLADSTDLSSSNTAASFSFNLAAEKSVDSSLLFLFSFFFSPSLGTSINSRFIFFLPFLRLSFFLSLSRSFFFSPSIYLSIYLSGFVGTRLFASLFPRFLRMAGFGERTTLPPLNTANAFMNMHRDDPVQPGWMLAVESDMLARNRFISWYLIPLYTSQGQEGRETGRECSRLSLTFALETSSEVDSATSFRIGKLGSGEDFGLGFEEFPIRDRCCVIT